MADGKPRRVVIVGGGVAGLSLAGTLATARIPVTLLEASKLGHGASTRNQGWQHSGAWFAPTHADLARDCHASLQRTLRFCPDAVEPGHEGMAYAFVTDEGGVEAHTAAWTECGIPFRELSSAELGTGASGFDTAAIRSAFLLPDRSVRHHLLLDRLAEVAEDAGAELRTETSVTELVTDDGGGITGVRTGNDETVAARVVVLAAGTGTIPLYEAVTRAEVGSQCEDGFVVLKAHLISLQPRLGTLPFCLVDDEGFNHLPHAEASVFGIDRWHPVKEGGGRGAEANEVEVIESRIAKYFPDADLDAFEKHAWAGTMVQAMHVEQIEPGGAPLPTVIDHGADSPRLANLISIHPGRATLWSHTADEAAALVAEKLDHEIPTTTKPPWAE